MEVDRVRAVELEKSIDDRSIALELVIADAGPFDLLLVQPMGLAHFVNSRECAIDISALYQHRADHQVAMTVLTALVREDVRQRQYRGVVAGRNEAQGATPSFRTFFILSRPCVA